MIHFVTVYTDKEKLKYFLKTNLDIHCIHVDWKGFYDKIESVYKYIQNLPDDDIICYVDSYDMLSYANEDEILQKFKDYDCDLLLSSELCCYPSQYKRAYDYYYSIYPVETNFKYVNAGAYIGYKHAIMDLFHWKPMDDIKHICFNEYGSDQNYFNLYFLYNYEKCIKMDIYQKIFQSMYKVDFTDFEFRNGRLYNKCLETYPCFTHFNGFGVWDMQLKHIHTWECKNVIEIFSNYIEQSINTILSIEYELPYQIVWNGITETNVPQK
jgi:hypothetical protein